MSCPGTTGGSMALTIDSETYTSLTSNLGVQVAKAISHKNSVILPKLRVGWIDEFENDRKQIGATFIDDINQQPLFVLTKKPDHNYFKLGVDLTTQFAKGRFAFLSDNTLLDYQDVTYNAVNADMRLEF